MNQPLRPRYAFQSRLLNMLNELSLRNNWNELKIGLKYFNKILTRYYINPYWKFLFQIASNDFLKYIDSIPQFIDCLQSININSRKEVIYSIVFLLFSRNQFLHGSELLKMYHLTADSSLTAKEKDVNILNKILNTNLEFIKWKQEVCKESFDAESLIAQHIAEKCTFEMQLLIESLDLADAQINQLGEIFIFYNKINELHEILENYSAKNPDYLNAHKYLFEFEKKFMDKVSLDLFQKIARLSPADSYIFKYHKYFNNVIMSIDCLFDMLDYYQWKYNKDCWSCLNKLIVKSEKLDTIKECILENWTLRKNYWIPYHFQAITEIYSDINKYRFSLAIVLMGPNHNFVKTASSLCKFDLINFSKEMEVYNWLLG